MPGILSATWNKIGKSIYPFALAWAVANSQVVQSSSLAIGRSTTCGRHEARCSAIYPRNKYEIVT
jgi:hypothetical protein